MNDQQTLSLNVRDLSELVFRHKKKVVLFPLLCILLGVIVILFCPRTYRSESKLFLRVGRESVALDPTAVTGHTIAYQQFGRKDEVKSAIELIGSRGVIAQAVVQLGPDVVLSRAGEDAAGTNYVAAVLAVPVQWLGRLVRSIDPISAREEAAIKVERHLCVDAEPDSTLLVVQYDAKSPQLAQRVCTAIVDVYQKEHMRIHRNEESRPFFTEQQERLKKQLDATLEAMRDAKNEMGLSSVAERRTTLEAQFSSVELEKLNAQQQLATARARVADLEQQLEMLPERTVASRRSIPNEGADLLRDQLYQLEVKYADLRARYSESHPLVQALKQQLQEAQQVVTRQSAERTETTDDVNPVYRELTLNLKQQQSIVAGLEARLNELEFQKQVALGDLREVNEYDLKLDQLGREAELARARYMQFARNMEEARVDQELQKGRISNVSLAQAATLAEKPVRPSKLLVAIATLVLATAGTATLVLVSEQMNAPMRTNAEVEAALGAPVTGAHPYGRSEGAATDTNANGRRAAVQPTAATH